MTSTDELRRRARRHRRMADEIAGYPEFEGRDEKVREHRAESAELYRQARALERPRRSSSSAHSPTRKPAAKSSSAGARTSSSSSSEPWTPGRALRRAGVATGKRADEAARNAPKRATRAARNADALPAAGGPNGVGGLVVYVFVSIVALALLRATLSGRGPAAISTSFGFLGGAIQRLFSASDPLIARGQLPGSSSSSGSSSPAPAATAANPRAAATYVHTVKGG